MFHALLTTAKTSCAPAKLLLTPDTCLPFFLAGAAAGAGDTEERQAQLDPPPQQRARYLMQPH